MTPSALGIESAGPVLFVQSLVFISYLIKEFVAKGPPDQPGTELLLSHPPSM